MEALDVLCRSADAEASMHGGLEVGCRRVDVEAWNPRTLGDSEVWTRAAGITISR